MAFMLSLAGILQLASSVASASHVHSGRRYVDMDPVFAIPALLTNMVYLTWICEIRYDTIPKGRFTRRSSRSNYID